ncbi:MAG: hypothetical protein FWF82_05940, partial [Oscillospiraceae bacterium]|nr:hypothetical protein [Oscillospiraceae bacterium]
IDFLASVSSGAGNIRLGVRSGSNSHLSVTTLNGITTTPERYSFDWTQEGSEMIALDTADTMSGISLILSDLKISTLTPCDKGPDCIPVCGKIKDDEKCGICFDCKLPAHPFNCLCVNCYVPCACGGCTCDKCSADSCEGCKCAVCVPPEIYEPGRIVPTEDRVTINSALEILKYLAKLDSTTVKIGTASWSNALIVDKDAEKPTINDALDVLKYLAKLESSELYKKYGEFNHIFE